MKKIELNDLTNGSFHKENLRRVIKEFEKLKNTEDNGIVLIPGEQEIVFPKEDFDDLEKLKKILKELLDLLEKY